jgi:hypothetical protein
VNPSFERLRSNFRIPGKGWVVIGFISIALSAFALTKINQVAIENSTIDATVIGSTAPSTATFLSTHVNNSPASFPTQGSYAGWSNLGLGETDFFNNSGTGVGGFYFLNGHTSQSTLAYLDNTGNLHATNFTGSLLGNVQGTVTGAVTGSLTGPVTGNLTGSVTGGTVSGTLGAFNQLVGNPQGAGGGFNPGGYTEGGWLSHNQTGGTIGEADFISLHTAAQQGGFYWYNTTGTLSGSPLMTLNSAGALTVAGVFSNLSGNVIGNLSGVVTGSLNGNATTASSTTGNAATASSFDHTPTPCVAGVAGVTGIAANGTLTCSVTQYAKTTSVNATGSGPYSEAATSVPFFYLMPDTNYAASCSIVNPFGIPSVMGINKFVGSITVTLVNGGTTGAEVASGGSEIDCTITGS